MASLSGTAVGRPGSPEPCDKRHSAGSDPPPEIRAELAERREALKRGSAPGDTPVEIAVRRRLEALAQPSLRPVINATGVVLHTNLGRAPLPRFEPLPGYSNLEYDLKSGKRGKRDVHAAPLLERLIARPAILVNNNAAAVFLVLTNWPRAMK